MADPILNTQRKLEEKVRQIAADRGVPEARARMLVCSLVVSQMLPEPTIVKGGIGVKLRLGETGTRATTDFDVATSSTPDDFKRDLDARLRTGWGQVPPGRTALKKNADAQPTTAFTGRSKVLAQASPQGVPAQYLMQPYHVTLMFMGSDWGSVKLEVGHDELDGTHESTVAIADELVDLAEELGFGPVEPVGLISVEQQLAQKIHAVTEPGSDRAHDLVDIQLLWDETVDQDKLAELCRRTFAVRNGHTWPPGALRMPETLDALYEPAHSETQVNGDPGVLPTLAEATAWFDARMEALPS